MTGEIGTGPTNPRVSVVVPTYQHAAFIEQCIQGILMQETSFPVEILIGEDESTDGTRAICERIAAEHPERIRLFLRSRKDVIYVNGMPTGRGNLMKLLAQARGEYISFCEGDDFWTEPDKLASQVALIATDKRCIGAYHDTVLVDADGKSTGRLFRENLPERMSIDRTMGTLSPFHFSSFMVRATTLVRTLPKWARTVPSLDTLMFNILIGDGYYAKTGGVMSAYRKHPGGITNAAMHKGTGFDLGRVKLWTLFDQYDMYRHTRRAEELFLHHWRHIVQQSSPRTRLCNLAGLMRTAPGWFLRKPGFTLRRLREALKR